MELLLVVTLIRLAHAKALGVKKEQVDLFKKNAQFNESVKGRKSRKMAKRTIFSLSTPLPLMAALCLASVMLIGIAPVYGDSSTKHVTIVIDFQGLGNSQSAGLFSGDKLVGRCVSKNDTQNEDTRRITANLRGVGVMFSIHFYSQANCQGKATSVRRSTQVGGTVTCTADNDQACQLKEFDPGKLITVVFGGKSFTGSLKGASLFIDGKQYGSCITSDTLVTGPSDNATTFEVDFFNKGDCTGSPAEKPSFDIKDGQTKVSCTVDDKSNCKPQ